MITEKKEIIRIIERKNSGKTKTLMKECERTNGIFVCANPYAAKEKAHAYGIYGILNFISYGEFLNNIDIKNGPSNYYIDEVENIFCNKVKGYTISLE